MGTKYTSSMFDTAVSAYKRAGTAVPYIDALKLSKAEKSRLLESVMDEVKGAPPKFNPFYEPKPVRKPKKAVRK